MSSPATPPIVSRAVAVRAALRAAPPGLSLVVLALAGAPRWTTALCGSIAMAAAVGVLVERLAVVRAWGRRASWRCALEAALACAFVHTGALANAVWWLGATPGDLAGRIDAALAGNVAGTLLVVSLAGWVLAGPSGLLALREHGRWPGAPGAWRDDENLGRWFMVWSAPAALVLSAACVAAAGTDLPGGLARGALVAWVAWFGVGVVGTMLVLVCAVVDDLAWQLASDAAPLDGEPT